MRGVRRQLINKLRNIKNRSERGFTMIEIVVTLGIVAILASIAYPVWTSIQNAQHESSVKQKLSQAAVLLEQEAIDNNGYVPKYVPNEILNDPLLKTFSYEHKERLEWCVIARITKNSLIPFAPSTATAWFVSSDDPTPSQTKVCGGVGYEPLDGSSAPWEYPTIVSPSITNHTTTWPNGSNYARMNATIAPGTCTLTNSDDDLFEPSVSLKFRIEMQNLETGRTNTVLTTSLSASTAAEIASLVGFLPGDDYRIRVQSVCNVSTNNGYPYEYYSQWSNYVTGSIATFVVPAPTWTDLTFNVGKGGLEVANRIAASWTSPFACPVGSTKRYEVNVSLPGVSGGAAQKIDSTSPALSNVELTQNRPGFRHSFSLVAICDYSTSGAEVKVSSTPSIREDRSPMRPPAGALSIAEYTSPATSVKLTPSGFILNRAASSQFACATGTPVARMKAVDNLGRAYIDRTVAFNTISDFYSEMESKNAADTTITVTGEALCSGIVDGLSQSSEVSPDKAIDSFLIRYKIPPVPAAPATSGYKNDNLGTNAYKNDRLTWTAVTCQFDGTPEYSVRQMQKSSVTVYAAESRPTLPVQTATAAAFNTTYVGPGSTVKFEVASRCKNDVGTSAWSEYTTGTGATWTTSVPTPGAPGVTGSGVSMTISLPTGVTCPAGTTYQVKAVSDRDQRKNLMANPTTIANNAAITGVRAYTMPGKARGHWMGGYAAVRCVGPDAAGAYGANASIIWGYEPLLNVRHLLIGGATGSYGWRRVQYGFDCDGGIIVDGYINIYSTGNAGGSWGIPLGSGSSYGEVYQPNAEWGSGSLALGARCTNPIATDLTTVIFPGIPYG